MSIQNLFTSNNFPLYINSLSMGDNTITKIDTDVSMEEDSDSNFTTQKAVKAYITAFGPTGSVGPTGPDGATGSVGIPGSSPIGDGPTGPTGANGGDADSWISTTITPTFSGPIADQTFTIHLKKKNKVVFYDFVATGDIAKDTTGGVLSCPESSIPTAYLPFVANDIYGRGADGALVNNVYHRININGSIYIQYAGGSWGSDAGNISVYRTSGLWFTTS